MHRARKSDPIRKFNMRIRARTFCFLLSMAFSLSLLAGARVSFLLADSEIRILIRFRNRIRGSTAKNSLIHES